MQLLLTQDECRVLGSLIEKEITTPEYYPLSLNALLNACNQKSNREPVTNLDEAAVRQALHSLGGQSLVRSVSASDSRVTKYEHRLQEAFNFYRHEIAIVCVLLLRGPQTPGELRTRAERMHHFDDLSAVHSSLHHLMQREPPLVKVLARQPGTKEARYAHLLSGDVPGSKRKEGIARAEGSGRAEGIARGERAERAEDLEPWSAEAHREIAEEQATHENAYQRDHSSNSVDPARIAQLEAKVAALREDLAALHNDATALRSDNAALRKEVAALQQQLAAFRKQFE